MLYRIEKKRKLGGKKKGTKAEEKEEEGDSVGFICHS